MKKIILLVILPWLLLSACGAAEVSAGGDTGGTGTVPEADHQPPLFGPGGMSAHPVSGVALYVTWPEAADGVTDRLLLEYRLYYSTASNLTSVAAVTNNGTAAMVWTRNIQERLVTGLAAESTYHFAVLARDLAGNLALCSGAIAATGPPPGLVRTIQIAGQAVRFRYCPGGVFPMGSTDATLGYAAPFWISETEVPYGLWYAVNTWAASNNFTVASAGQEGSGGTPGAAPTAASNQPVCNLSWVGAVIWCNAASAMAGLPPVYLSNSDPASVCRYSTNHWTSPYKNPVVLSSGGLRLPTWEEWSAAARYRDGLAWSAGNQISGSGMPNTSTLNTNYAWYGLNAGGATRPVGLLLPNALGCHDMSGNVRELLFISNVSDIRRVMTGGDFASNPCYSLGVTPTDTTIYSIYLLGGLRLVVSDIP